MSADSPVAAAYLLALRDLRATGAAVKETSYYPPLAALLDSVGGGLKPPVRAVGQLKNFLGAGSPDFGLYAADQFPKRTDLAEPAAGQLPARGVLEVKGPGDDVLTVAASPQVARYLAAYGLVLVTNYRDFLLVSRSSDNLPVLGERYTLAASETVFWNALANPAALAARHGVGLTEFLRRALLHEAPLADPRDVAFFLASYARHALARLDEQPHLPALDAVRHALEEALGVQFRDEKGAHFFRSTLVQTLFYGVFSAWVLWSREQSPTAPATRFDWRLSAWSLRVPILRTLFVQLADPGRLQPLGLDLLLDWTAAALRRVDRHAFFHAFDAAGADAVQYFYEPFLAAFDPALRRELGVWFTPREIVRYQVARVDSLLKTELQLPDGLADPRVLVLDPCCGTGAYLVETLRRIEENLRARGDADALLASDLKTAARERLFGFELLPAPFVIAHLQLGLLLTRAGAPLGEGERAAVFLTNALTDWDPTGARRANIPFPEFAEERAAAGRVKQEAKILVVLGNPPYNGFAGLAVEEERDLSDAYRADFRPGGEGTPTNIQLRPGLPAPQGQGLNDLYVRFFRMAERCLVDGPASHGIVSFISNYSWLDGLSHPLMRARYLQAFDQVWIDCLNGDKYKTGKQTPEGRPDPSVFSTESNREGIQVGTAIATLVRRGAGTPLSPVVETLSSPAASTPLPPAVIPSEAEGPSSFGTSPADGIGGGWRGPSASLGMTARKEAAASSSPPRAAVRFRHFWGKEKRAELEASAEPFDPAAYAPLAPSAALGLPFVPVNVENAYLAWPRLPDLLPTNFPGVKTSRDDFLIAVDRAELEKRVADYFDIALSDEEIARCYPGVMESSARYDARAVRHDLLERGPMAGAIVRYCYRPLDVRWLFWINDNSLLDRPRPEYYPQIFPGNRWLSAGQRNRKEDFYQPQITSVLADHHIVESNVAMFPLLFSDAPILNGHADPPRPNLSPAATAYLARLDAPADSLFFHAVATLHAPAYRAENAGALRQDWPRIPLPADRDALLASAALGRRVAALLDPETPVPGVTAGSVPEDLRYVGVLRKLGDAPLDPATDLAVTAGWGSLGAGGAVMPGRGKWLEYISDPGSAYVEALMTSLATGKPAPHFEYHPCVVYLNDSVYWSAVPRTVWEFTLGGYPVLKKWLSYREQSVLGRALRPEEAREFTAIARRLAALLRLGPDLDAAYRAACVRAADRVGGAPGAVGGPPEHVGGLPGAVGGAAGGVGDPGDEETRLA